MERMLCLLAVCGILAMFSGCCNSPLSRPVEVPAVNNSGQLGSTPFSQSVVFNLEPQPVETMPAMYAVEVQVSKNPIATNPYIVIDFRGGAGQSYTRSMDATVIRSDETVEYESLPYPKVGSEIILNGTPHLDRVIVDISLVSGDRYRVYDQLVPLKSLG
ncbi:MAG TPA: hypothetical protein VMC42_08130 [Methanoregulaceae archaeon]|nr:hypothetical protein [Methanoregulaceae archaeon]